MRYAILSDVHASLLALECVLADARRHDIEAVLCLGDVGSDACLDRLRQAGADMIFGNWEVSQWSYLREDNQAWVRDLAPLLVGDNFMAIHAAPWFPKGLSNVEDFMSYILHQKVKWRVLFPYLDQDQDARWQAVSELENAGRAILFHGHTHVQIAYRVEPNGPMVRLRQSQFTLDGQARYIVGVGSVGRPEDSPGPKYVLYDDDIATIYLRTLG